ncbi:cytochrome P450 [Mycobacterium malmoense]|uniref:Cytochrome n=1 Tax=Mycobacterium malmoense TaxID=1780 RepID=A0ABX3SSZ3_MYCMA|nr:cytochrome P450 [Mycobacterium malmoense]ORA83297.1 cytochrome [Mycobacterium malmoense]QZA16071.1 cytochrome P450 [Mycobacterium malmoense]UNB92883.1 cytochrome P450 [Mycobacterium malmoense]
MYDDIDLTDLNRFTTGFPYEVFDVLRDESPVWFHPPTAHTPGDEGFWVLSRYADIVAAAADPVTFSSETGGGREGGGTTLEDMPRGLAVGALLNMTDDPRHAQIRRLLTPSTTPRALRAMEEDLRRRAVAIVDAALAKRECDFLVDVAAELPLQAIAQLVGVPQADRHELMNWANVTLDYEDREVGEINDRVVQAQAQMFTYGTNLLERKRSEPSDDLLSVVTQALIDGEPLTENEQRMFLSLIIAAGSETTRNSIAIGMSALSEHPDAWEHLRHDRELLPVAVEEMLRWASSTPYNRRTATRDVDLHGQHIAAGDKVTLWWASANRDDAVFADPYTFDITRNPNPHLTFGRGVHFCLGASLARLEMRVMFDALLNQVGTITLTGPIEYVRSNKHAGVRHMPVTIDSR